MFETKLSKLNVESCWILKVIEVESWKLLKVVECWKLLNLQSWILKVVECWKLSNVESCWILIVVKVECWKLSDIESGWMLKVVESSKLNLESWKLSNTVKVLNIESLLICCLLTSFQRRSYCTQSGIKWRKRSEELWKVIFQKKFYEFASSILADRIF